MNFRKIKIKVRIIIEADGDVFHAYCPELKGVHVSGDTEADALRNGCDAIKAYIAIIIQHDDPIPLGCIDSDDTFSIRALIANRLNELIGFKPKPHYHIQELSVAA